MDGRYVFFAQVPTAETRRDAEQREPRASMDERYRQRDNYTCDQSGNENQAQYRISQDELALGYALARINRVRLLRGVRRPATRPSCHSPCDRPEVPTSIALGRSSGRCFS